MMLPGIRTACKGEKDFLADHNITRDQYKERKSEVRGRKYESSNHGAELLILDKYRAKRTVFKRYTCTVLCLLMLPKWFHFLDYTHNTYKDDSWQEARLNQ